MIRIGCSGQVSMPGADRRRGGDARPGAASAAPTAAMPATSTCAATPQDPFGNGYTTDYDEEGSGALVGVHFTCSFVHGIYRKITGACTHHAD